MESNRDLYFEIYKHLDFDTLVESCNINKTIVNLCNDKHFWKSYFDTNQLPFVDKEYHRVSDYINEYINQVFIKFFNHIVYDTRTWNYGFIYNYKLPESYYIYML